MNVRDLSPGGFIQANLGHGFVSADGEGFTMLVYAKQRNDGREWLYSYGAGNTYWTFGIESSLLVYREGNGEASGPSPESGNWSFFIVTCPAAGASPPKFYIYNAHTEEWEADEVIAGVAIEQTGSAPPTVNLGVWDGAGSEHFDGLMAAAAYWRRELTKLELHALVTLGNVAAWKVGALPDLLLLMDEASPVDQSENGADVINTENTVRKSVLLPFPIREGEETGEEIEEEEEPAGHVVKVKSSGGLVTAKRFVVTEAGLVEA